MENSSSEEGSPVDLYVYDLTHGMASLLSPALLGQQIEGVWHTAVVVFGREYFYGGGGVTSCAPGSTELGAPLRVLRLGHTAVPRALFLDYVQGLAAAAYTGSKYNLLDHNCNNFSEEVAQFLCGAHIPKHILELPERALSGPVRDALQAMLQRAQPPPTQRSFADGIRHSRQESPDFLTLNHQIEEARLQSQQLEQRRSTLADKLARKEKRREKKRKKLQAKGLLPDHGDDQFDDMSEVGEAAVAGPSAPPSISPPPALDERRRAEETRRAADPPLVYRDLDGAAELEKLEAALAGAELTPEEHQSLEELRQYLVHGEGSWALGDDFLPFIGRLLNDERLTTEARVATLRCLATCALRDDVSLVLHQDRRQHALANWLQDVDRREPSEQLAAALLVCNLFEHVSSSEWLLYISEWEHNGRPLANIRVTTKVAVHSLLSEQDELREVGASLVYNLAAREVTTVVFDEVSVELAMALLQLLTTRRDEPESRQYRAATSLARLAERCPTVPMLLPALGLQPEQLRGVSPRVDEQIDLLMSTVKC